jgi:hypothetical protein
MVRNIFGWLLVGTALALGVYVALLAHSLESIYGEPDKGVLASVAGPFTGVYVALWAVASALLLGGLALVRLRRWWLPTLAGFLVLSVLAAGLGTWTGLESKQRYLDEQNVGMRQDGIRGESASDARGLRPSADPARAHA